ncbi:hypothetical protein TNCV_4197941 [Trichonephila clavipes]|nr:hypothetical protein TNCV_4197941 [Trichonephila clavipes]
MGFRNPRKIGNTVLEFEVVFGTAFTLGSRVGLLFEKDSVRMAYKRLWSKWVFVPRHIECSNNSILKSTLFGKSMLVDAGVAGSHPRVPRAHQAGPSRRSHADVGLSESVRYHGPGLALLTKGGVQQQQQ